MGVSILRSASSSYQETAIDFVAVKRIADAPIVHAERVVYIEEATRAWSMPIPCIASVDSAGAFYLHSLRDKVPISNVDLLGEVIDPNKPLVGGVVLPNGYTILFHLIKCLKNNDSLSPRSCYMRSDGLMILNGAPSSKAYILEGINPTRASSDSIPPPTSYQLSHGRDVTAAKAAAAGGGRRRSILSYSSAPTDLSKLFAKTRDQRQKEELFGPLRVEDSDGDEASTSANAAASRALSAAAETREAFMERGEKLKRLQQKMDGFKDVSGEYRQNIKNQKAKLQEKAQRWGFF